MATKPLVLPETFSGQEQDWSEWIDHFENVAVVNGWDSGEVKLTWLKVRLTGKAQAAFKKFTEADKATYDAAVKKLKDRFEPSSRREMYLAELPLKKKKHSESWGDFADDLRTLVERAYPNLDSTAQEEHCQKQEEMESVFHILFPYTAMSICMAGIGRLTSPGAQDVPVC